MIQVCASAQSWGQEEECMAMKNTMEGIMRRWKEHWRRDFDASQDGQRREDAEKGLWLVGAAGRRAGV